ncbi:murein transglycosylase A [uncultured Parasutterella sp.]|uniref:murein transglycosylase A n=1 Tax=uncultured Parasutterella sp. TaxID=1263098 RepID=UPI0027295D53|nr:MltA domain-containing protein [uncultured Parasutterella sp.]
MTFERKTLLPVSILAALLLCSCSSTTKKEDITEPTEEAVRYEISSFDELPSSDSQDWATALSAFKVSCRSVGKKADWKDVCFKAQSTDSSEAESFFKNNFIPWQISTQVIGKQTGTVYSKSDKGLMTGYYEPMLKVSSVRTAKHTIPILSTPDDLIIVDLASLYPKLKGMRLRGKIEGRKLVPYDSRAQIIKRHDLDKNAIAWSSDPVAVFFLQIQGSGRLQTEDGKMIRVGFDDQNGHPYKAVGSWLVEKGYLKRHELSMQNIRAWAFQNPDKVDTLLNQNPSFVFFKPREADNADEGPIGAQGLPLTPKASVAVDRKYIPLGTPLLVSVSQSSPALEFVRPVVAQDTGGAIKGPIRFDYFWGFGDEAGSQAGRQKSSVSAWLLLPKGVRPN